MFVGEYQVKFLGKGRIALPKKIRNLLTGSRVVLTRGFDNCVFGYEKKAWEASSEKQIEAPITEEKSRAIRRYLFSGAMVIKHDSQGRVVVPGYLLDYAQLGDDITIIGAGDHFEIWNTQLWQKELSSIENKKMN